MTGSVLIRWKLAGMLACVLAESDSLELEDMPVELKDLLAALEADSPNRAARSASQIGDCNVSKSQSDRNSAEINILNDLYKLPGFFIITFRTTWIEIYRLWMGEMINNYEFES